MPDINPTSGDLIEVRIDSAIVGSTATTFLARIMTKNQAGKWEVELTGTPTMRGTVDIGGYEWTPAQTRWAPRAEASVPGRPVKLGRALHDHAPAGQ